MELRKQKEKQVSCTIENIIGSRNLEPADQGSAVG